MIVYFSAKMEDEQDEFALSPEEEEVARKQIRAGCFIGSMVLPLLALALAAGKIVFTVSNGWDQNSISHLAWSWLVVSLLASPFAILLLVMSFVIKASRVFRAIGLLIGIGALLNTFSALELVLIFLNFPRQH